MAWIGSSHTRALLHRPSWLDSKSIFLSSCGRTTLMSTATCSSNSQVCHCGILMPRSRVSHMTAHAGLLICVQTTHHRTYTRALFLAAHARSHVQLKFKGWTICLCASKLISSLFTCLLNVPLAPFPPIFSLPTASPTPLTGIRLTPCATTLWSGPSGHVADPIPNTGHEPKLYIDVSSELTPINLPTRNMSSSKSKTRRSTLPRTSIYLDIPERRAAVSTRQQAGFPPCRN